MIDFFAEILASIRRNKMRTALTGFAVAWGIFILIVLLGAGNGVRNSFGANMSETSMNSAIVRPGWTQDYYKGFRSGRRIHLNTSDMELISKHLSDNVGATAPHLVTGSCTVSNGSKYISDALVPATPEVQEIQNIKMLHGRFINKIDIDMLRKVIVIDNRTSKILFGKDDESVLGQMVNANGLYYKVVGISEVDASRNEYRLNVPYSTLNTIYNGGGFIDGIWLVMKNISTIEEIETFETKVRSLMAEHHCFSPDDYGAVWIWNRFRRQLQSMGAMTILVNAIWAIGILTLISGIVGVSNIMLITVKERTKEFGIRKALGAKPGSILLLVMAESVAITAIFGYIGMLAGIGTTELMGMIAESSGSSAFVNPTVDVSVALQATLTLIVAGTLAGLMPARKAVSIKPIEALRAD